MSFLAAAITTTVIGAIGYGIKRSLADVSIPTRVYSPPTGSPKDCMTGTFFSPDFVASGPALNSLGPAGRAALQGVEFYLTPSGQEAILASLYQEFSAGNTYTPNRSLAVRNALSRAFPECNWARPRQTYTHDMEKARLSAWTIASAVEAELGIDANVGSRSGTPFLHREDLGMQPLQPGALSTGTLVLLIATDTDGEGGEEVQATIAGPPAGALPEQEVIVESQPKLVTVHGVKQGSRYTISSPWQVMEILQSATTSPGGAVTTNPAPSYNPYFPFLRNV